MTPAFSTTLCKSLSLLLHFPDENLLAALDTLESSVASLPSEAVAPVRKALAYLKSRPLVDLQERYTRLFDLSPATTLNLCCHLPGDPHAQAGRMCSLQGVYNAAGCQSISAELPDYLPLLLEFLSLAPDHGRHAPVSEVLAAVPILAEKLRAADDIYAGLLLVIAAGQAGNPENRPNMAST